MEVVSATPSGSSPFHNHDVREWSRLDSLTGVLERARLEADHWSATTNNSSHKYGKVVDSRARSGADGNVQQQAKRQLEVYQSQIPGGRVQVIKTQTVSSSRWSNNSPPSRDHTHAINQGFEDLQLALNPLDLSSQKSKASVGRSVGRRPPSRSRLKEDTAAATSSNAYLLHNTAVTNLHRVSRLCHQIHDTAVKRAFGNRSSPAAAAIDEQRQDGDGSVEITELESSTSSSSERTTTTKHSLIRTKSTSSEDLHQLQDPSNRSTNDLEDLEQLQNWRRTSKLRRSLQYPNKPPAQVKPPVDLPPDIKGNVRKIREDLETGRRLSTALSGNNVDLDALDQILQSISSSSSVQSDCTPERDTSDLIVAKKTKKNSFVTVESIQEVRGRLRRTSSPERDQETDDGIVTEENNHHQTETTMPSVTDTPQSSRVRSYVYGMETLLGQQKNKEISGTGSLESRAKQLNGSANALRNEDWYSRRKSYGFEQVHNETNDTSMPRKARGRIESSTDSGICRSSEIVLVPTATKVTCDSSESDLDNQYNKKSYFEISSKPVNDSNPFTSKKATEELASIWNRRASSLAKDVEPTKLRKPTSENYQDWSYKNGEDISNKPIDLQNGMCDVTNNSTDDDMLMSRKNKKVEFCKTEVHFAADSGRVNIVETDEKPPPTQNFRRRRRNTGNSGTFNLEELKKNGVPVLHFGDSSYEKTLFGDPELSQRDADEAIYENMFNKAEPVTSGNVTVNVNTALYDYEEDQKENYENGAPRGILKNKPIKPKPYILGDSSLSLTENPSKAWDQKESAEATAPIWRSTVTVRNNFYDKQAEANGNKVEISKSVRHVRPTTLGDSKRNSDSFGIVRVRTSPVDIRRSSWSVADRVKKVEDLQWTENKGYSTKINIGNGEATVVENRHPTWPRRDEDVKRNLLNKSLVVRIGKNEPNSSHMVCSKTTTNQNENGMTTTTKITIDLTPSPTNAQQPDFPTILKFPSSIPPTDAASLTFKSPSLIMNTIKTDFHNSNSTAGVVSDYNNKIKIPQQLEALRRLYDDIHSDTEADKEVQNLMSRDVDEEKEGDTSSILSGSWSKITAFKHINEFSNSSKTTSVNRIYAQNAHLEKGKMTNSKSSTTVDLSTNGRDILSDTETTRNTPQIKKYSPVILQKSSNNNVGQLKQTHQIKPELLSSPVLVGQSFVKNDQQKERKTPTENKISSNTTEVLRQPKKSEMAYFGVDVSPSNARKIKPSNVTKTKLSEKPDLLQFSVKADQKRFVSKRNESNKQAKNFSNNHIYENLDIVKKEAKYKPVKREFDRSILEELTKAADEILQAVNGYTDEEKQHKYSDEESDPRGFNPDNLETISENKSLKNNTNSQKTQSKVSSKSKGLKQASSTSSIDSISKESNKTTTKKQTSRTSASVTSMTKSVEQKQRVKKVVNTTETTVVKSATKARRLQRANSREALLQSHGSSSEDLAASIEVPLRKPRLVKRTKTTQLSMTNGLELKKPSQMQQKKKEEPMKKKEERVPSIGLPEIRHKTAVSTIRSTAEKVAASRERAKLRNEELKKKTTNSRKDYSKGVGGVSTSSRLTDNSRASAVGVRSSRGGSHEPTATTTGMVTSSRGGTLHHTHACTKKIHKTDGLLKQ